MTCLGYKCNQARTNPIEYWQKCAAGRLLVTLYCQTGVHPVAYRQRRAGNRWLLICFSKVNLPQYQAKAK
jgi:hypothetical protein